MLFMKPEELYCDRFCFMILVLILGLKENSTQCIIKPTNSVKLAIQRAASLLRFMEGGTQRVAVKHKKIFIYKDTSMHR